VPFRVVLPGDWTNSGSAADVPPIAAAAEATSGAIWSSTTSEPAIRTALNEFAEIEDITFVTAQDAAGMAATLAALTPGISPPNRGHALRFVLETLAVGRPVVPYICLALNPSSATGESGFLVRRTGSREDLADALAPAVTSTGYP